MSEHENYHNMQEENLMALADHAQNQIELWSRRLDKVLGILATRYALEEFPEN
jgi:hypothetical protein